MSTEIQQAIDTLSMEMKNDPEYAWSWHCNIACSSLDEGLDIAASNRAAARFMKTAFGVDTSKIRYFKQTQ